MFFKKMRTHLPRLIRCMSRENNQEIREMAAMIVRDYLSGPWQKVTSSNIVVKRVNGGLSNWLYQIALPSSFHNQAETTDPKTVLLRFHGQIHGETAFEHIIMETVIFTLLSERKLGPRLHGIFPGGRIEEYLQARPLKTSELADPKLSSIIASKMAQIHLLHVPISKKDKCMFELMDKWLFQVEEDLEDYRTSDTQTQKLINKFKSYNLRAEIEWLRQYLPTIDSPIVFCHNDVQEGNILIQNDSADSKHPNLVLIDYEYCSYNYRGFDLANHFLEYTINYTKPEYPYFTVDQSAYPTVEQQMKFIRQYLYVHDSLRLMDKKGQCTWDETLDNNHNSSYLSMFNEFVLDVSDQETQLLREVSNFRLASHLLWAIWSAKYSQSAIEFGYWEYCIARLEAYFETKEEVLNFEVPGT